MYFRCISFVVLLILHMNGVAQNFVDQVPQLKRYQPKEVVDSEYGITIYDKLIFALGGDSIRYNKKGYNAQGWVEDYFTDGSLMHKGFYVDGQLNTFKNYYPGGQVERVFRVVDIRRSELTVFYPDGKIKSEVYYYNHSPQKQTDYYANGNIEYAEENEKDMKYLYKRNSFYENGVPEVIFEITDKKKKNYIRKEFYTNGKIKEEGRMLFQESVGDYTREGEWLFYNDRGELTAKENYINGQLLK